MTLIINPEMLCKIANEMEITTERLHQCMELIENLVVAMAGDWQGAAGTEYQNKIIALKYEYGKLETLMKDYTSILREAAENYCDIDNMLAQKFRFV